LAGHVFITGASGRIASHLIPRLIQDGNTVVGLARTKAKAARVEAMGARCVVGDLQTAHVIEKCLDGAQTLFHLAGGMRGPGQDTPDRINRLGTLALIDRLKEGPQLDSVVFTSSGAVYGDRSGLWVDDDMPAHPHTRYGRSKLSAEQAMLEAASQGIPVRVVRLAAVYGPGFPFMLEELIRSGRAWLPGEGRNYIHTIHIDDAVEGLIRIAEPSAIHDRYNLADLEPATVADFYRAVAGAVGGTPPKHWSTWVPSYVQFSAARLNERIQSKLPMRPRFTPDAIRLMTASVRLKTDRLEQERGMVWQHPKAIEGVVAALLKG
jgi:nucleoside-diphosphate-sugar epimerase